MLTAALATVTLQMSGPSDAAELPPGCVHPTLPLPEVLALDIWPFFQRQRPPRERPSLPVTTGPLLVLLSGRALARSTTPAVDSSAGWSTTVSPVSVTDR